MSKSSILAGLLAVAAVASQAAAKDAPGLVVQSGESWIFRIEQGQPTHARKVDAEAKPNPGELLVTLNPKSGTMLTVINNTDKFYNYRAFMLRKPDDGGKRTSVCTLMSNGRMGFENWPYALPAIRLSDFTEAAENTMQCS